MMAEQIRASRMVVSSTTTRSEIGWRDDMIRGLCETLKFYAAETNYQRRGRPQNQYPDKALVDSDNGRRARIALIKARDALHCWERTVADAKIIR
jgi:hypothetical protein